MQRDPYSRYRPIVKRQSEQHQQRSRHDPRKTQRGFLRQLLVEHKIGEQHRYQNTQLVDGDYHAGRAVLQRPVVAKPAAAGGEAGQADEAQFVLGDGLQFSLLAGDEHHHPRHHQHHRRANGRPQIGLNPGDADFSKDGRQTGKHSRTQRIPQPCGAFGFAAALFWIKFENSHRKKRILFALSLPFPG